MLSSSHRACHKSRVNGNKITPLKIQAQMWRAPVCQQSMTPNKVAQPMVIKRIHPKDQTNSSINQIPSLRRLASKESWSFPKTKSREFKKTKFPLSATQTVYKTRVSHRFELTAFESIGSDRIRWILAFLNIQEHHLPPIRFRWHRSTRLILSNKKTTTTTTKQQRCMEQHRLTRQPACLSISWNLTIK